MNKFQTLPYKAIGEILNVTLFKTFYTPSLILFLRPNVPILSQNDSSFSFLAIIGFGDLGRRVAMSSLLLK